MRPSLLLAVPLLACASASASAQDSALTALLVANRHPVAITDGRLGGEGGRMLVREGERSRFFLVGEEHGVAEVPQVVESLLRELRPAGYNTLAIEVSPLQGERLDGMSGRPGSAAALDTLLSTWRSAIPFYSLREERRFLASALAAQDNAPAMRIWGLDYEVSADRLLLKELEALVPAGGRATVRGARALADSGFALLTRGNPSRLFAWTAPDSVFVALRGALGPSPSRRGVEIVETLGRSASINRAMLSGQGYRSNIDRAAFLRRNLASALERARRDGSSPRVLFKFGGNHVMRGYNYTHTLDLGTAATIAAEAEGEQAFTLLVVGGPGAKTSRMNIVKGQYEPVDGAEIDGANLAWLRPAVTDGEWSLFDLRATRERWLAARRPALTAIQDRFLHAFDAILVLGGSTPGEVVRVEMR